MAISPNSKSSYHARSISLPSRPHPLIPEFDQHLCRLRASEATSSSSISHKLSGLRNLHDCVDNLLLLPFTQQSLAQHHQEKWVDKLLDGSLRLLDLCDTDKDALLQTREAAHELQSCMRRNRGSENMIPISNGVEKYLTSRKNVKKAINKVLRNLKSIENKCSFSALNRDDETLSTISMLREVETVSLSVLEALLSSISGVTTQSKRSNWSLVSKLTQHKRVACEEAEANLSEFEKVDAVLCTLLGQKIRTINTDNVHNEVAKLESSIQDLEEGLEFLSKRLIKTRVSLLNILSH